MKQIVRDYSIYESTNQFCEERIIQEQERLREAEEKRLREERELESFMRRFARENRMSLGYETPNSQKDGTNANS